MGWASTAGGEDKTCVQKRSGETPWKGTTRQIDRRITDSM